MTHKLHWTQDTDDDGNNFYEAASPYGDGPEGDVLDPFYFRLKQRLVNNAIEWYEASDPECMADEGDPRTWPTLEEAMAAMQKDDEEIRASIAAEIKRSPVPPPVFRCDVCSGALSDHVGGQPCEPKSEQ